MKKINLSRINVLLCDPDHAYRSSIYGMLRGIEIENISQVANLTEVQQKMAISMPDLLITESNIPNGDVCKFIHRLRHNNEDADPFLPIITLTAEPTPEIVRAIVNSGSDDLLTKPMSAAQLSERIIGIIQARKPFVVTSDYIGPTRRKSSDRESNVPLIDVPNNLQDKATGVSSGKNYQQAVYDMVNEINLQKLDRYAFQIGYLTERIVPALRVNEVTDEIRDHVKRMGYVASDAMRRLGGTKYDHVSNLCQALIKVTTDIHRDLENTSEKNISLLEQVSAAIQIGFESGTAQTAQKIVDSLGGSDNA